MRMFKKIEMRKVSGLINKEGYIPFTEGHKIIKLIKGAKTYTPKYEMYLK